MGLSNDSLLEAYLVGMSFDARSTPFEGGVECLKGISKGSLPLQIRDLVLTGMLPFRPTEYGHGSPNPVCQKLQTVLLGGKLRQVLVTSDRFLGPKADSQTGFTLGLL